jgi:predicted phosphodiesterase
MSGPLFHLFRYRNLLTDDTLAAHRAVIGREGSCWWGWWQRPFEDSRLELWEALELELRGGPLEIGLFNSAPDGDGGGVVHLAQLAEVVRPRGDHAAPAVPKPELVPDYYRETPFSSAWMRLTNISPDPLPAAKFFGKYSFARAPKLAGINADQRERFVDKKVLDADELRTMDTTIWELRKSKSGDREHRILTASTRVTSALDDRPIPLRSNKILHLSDLHFATVKTNRDEHRWHLTNEGATTLQRQIVHALGSKPDVGLVIISGDLTYRAEADEFYEAFRFIHALLGTLGLGTEHLVMVPGNHDIAWTKKHVAWQPELPVSEAPEAATKQYRDFYERVFRHPAASHFAMARRFVCPTGICLEVGGLNTSALEQGKSWLAGMGRVDDSAFGDVASTLGWLEGTPSLALRVLALHHHVTPTEDVLPTAEFTRGFGMASDAKRTLRQAARSGVHLILHGHRHQPFLGAEQVYAELERTQSSWSLGKVGIVGAGSAGSTSVRNHDNYFNVFEVHPTRVDLDIFRCDSPEGTRGEFSRMHHWTAPLHLGQQRLLIGDWTPSN